MASVLETLTKKLEVLGEGRIYEEHLYEPEKLLAVIELEDPRIYKPLFNLDNKGGLAIEKTLKTLLVEVKNSECIFYYLLDSACLSLTLTCKYQLGETIREVPLSLISYLRVLCSKKAPIEISLEDDFIYIVFEDSIPKDTTPKPKLKKGEKREKEIGKKYVLELPLINPETFNLQIGDIHKKIVDSDREEIDNIISPIDLSSISYEKQPLEVYKYEVEYAFKGNKCKLIVTNELSINLSICPMEVGRDNTEEVEDIKIYEFEDDTDESSEDIGEETDDTN